MGKRRDNGAGHIEKLNNGKVRIRRQYGKKSNGKVRILTATADTKKKAEEEIRKAVERVDRELGLVPDTPLTLGQLCQDHLTANLKQKDRLKPKSADRRECTIKNQILPYSISNLQAQAVMPGDIQMHIECLIDSEKKLSVSTIEKTFDVINAAFKWAISQGRALSNPCVPIKDEVQNRLSKLKEKRSCDADVIVLSEDEEKAIRKTARIRNANNGKYKYEGGLSVLLLLETGMRCGELCARRWKDVNWKDGTLDISTTRFVAKNRKNNATKTYVADEGIVKNCHAREIVLTEDALKILNEMYALAEDPSEDDYIIKNRVGKPTDATKLGVCGNTVYRNSGLSDDISGLHILRRTFATRKYFDEGWDIKLLAAYMGDLESTVLTHYIAVRKKIRQGNTTKNVVPLPKKKK